MVVMEDIMIFLIFLFGSDIEVPYFFGLVTILDIRYFFRFFQANIEIGYSFLLNIIV